jgi:transposase InsO family protein
LVRRFQRRVQAGRRALLLPADRHQRCLAPPSACEALESIREDLAITGFEQLFQERGLPEAIRSDNGAPFASPNALFNLSKLSVWWPRRGHRYRADQARNPQQNGRHERMHLTLKKEATRPPGMDSLQQQARQLKIAGRWFRFLPEHR